MEDTIRDNYKRYLVSTSITFLAGFLGVMALEVQSITFETLNEATLVGVFLSAFRAGVKVAMESLIYSLRK